jgi:hypothetical protein
MEHRWNSPPHSNDTISVPPFHTYAGEEHQLLNLNMGIYMEQMEQWNTSPVFEWREYPKPFHTAFHYYGTEGVTRGSYVYAHVREPLGDSLGGVGY